jgi:Raf kinase inhibitor-like YbhB/YbcL family protein
MLMTNMLTTNRAKLRSAIGGSTMLAWCMTAAAAPATFVLSSSTFKDGTLMPPKVALKDQPGCGGEDISPQLTWSHAPDGTKSFALTMVSEEGQGGMGEPLLVAYGVAANVTSFAEGELSQASDKFVGGTNIHGLGTYDGPCHGAGSSHHYMFKVIATDLDPKALAPGLTLSELQDKLQGHAKGVAGLVGLFTKSQ